MSRVTRINEVLAPAEEDLKQAKETLRKLSQSIDIKSNYQLISASPKTGDEKYAETQARRADIQAREKARKKMDDHIIRVENNIEALQSLIKVVRQNKFTKKKLIFTPKFGFNFLFYHRETMRRLNSNSDEKDRQKNTITHLISDCNKNIKAMKECAIKCNAEFLLQTQSEYPYSPLKASPISRN